MLAQEDLRRQLFDIGVAAMGNSPAEFSAAIRTELVLWAKLIQEAGIRASEAAKALPNSNQMVEPARAVEIAYVQATP